MALQQVNRAAWTHRRSTLSVGVREWKRLKWSSLRVDEVAVGFAWRVRATGESAAEPLNHSKSNRSVCFLLNNSYDTLALSHYYNRRPRLPTDSLVTALKLLRLM